jgi:hypothetical protein
MAALARKTLRFAVVAAVAAATAIAAPAREARADQVSSTGKGIVGLGLLGAETVTIVEGIAGVREPLAYIIGGVVGAGGGAVGGYFIEQGSSDGELPMYLLAGGMALIIPAIVVSLNATRYQPEPGATEDHAPTGPAPEPGAPGGSVGEPAPAAAPPPATTPPAPPPQSFFDIHQGSFRLGIPVPQVRPVFSLAERQQYGIREEGTELRMPVLRVTF